MNQKTFMGHLILKFKKTNLSFKALELFFERTNVFSNAFIVGAEITHM
jgi:hypothetical protein